MKRVLLLCVLLSSIAACAAGLYVSHFSHIKFTKDCHEIDATHCRCDGVILTHSPEVHYSKSIPAPTNYSCSPD
jgi:hypothetical protein